MTNPRTPNQIASDMVWEIVAEREGLPQPGKVGPMHVEPDEDVTPYPFAKRAVIILGLAAASWGMVFIVGRAVVHALGIW